MRQSSAQSRLDSFYAELGLRAADLFPAAVALLDRSGLIVFANAAWREERRSLPFLGSTARETTNFFDCCKKLAGLYREEAEIIAAGVRSVLNGEREEFGAEYSVRVPRQTWFSLFVTPTIENGVLTGALLQHQDITSQKLDELELRSREECFRSLSEVLASSSLSWEARAQQILWVLAAMAEADAGVFCRFAADRYRVVSTSADDQEIKAGGVFSIAGDLAEVVRQSTRPLELMNLSTGSANKLQLRCLPGLAGSLVAVPVAVGGEVEGFLALACSAPRAAVLTELEQQALKIAAQWFSQSLEVQWKEQLAQIRRQVLEAISSAFTLEDCLRPLNGISSSAEAAQTVAVYRLGSEGKLEIIAAEGLSPNFAAALNQAEIGLNSGAAGCAAFLGEMVVSEDIAGDPLWSAHREAVIAEGFKACIAQPIFSGSGRVTGVCCFFARQPQHPTAWQLGKTKDLAALAALAIEGEAQRLQTLEAQSQALAQELAKLKTETERENARLKAESEAAAASLKEEREREEAGRRIEIERGEARLREEREREERSKARPQLESLQRLAGAVGVDLQRLTADILDHAALALLELAPRSTAAQRVREIEQAAQNSAGIAHELLNYSGLRKRELSPLSIAGIAGEMGALLQAAVGDSARLELEIRDSLPAVMGESFQLRQLITYLVLNAAEAMTEGVGKIILRARALTAEDFTQDSFVYVAKPEAGEYLALEVADSGAGMPPEIQGRIFDPFFSTKPEHSGLGLARVLGIVYAHNASIGVSSSLGEGTTVRVLLSPTERRIAPDPSAEAKAAASLTHDQAVLIFDADEASRETAASMLAQQSFLTVTAETIEEAQMLVGQASTKVTAVILGVDVPDKTTFEVVDKLQGLKTGLGIVIAGSKLNYRTRRELGKRRLVSFLKKPFNSEELIGQLTPLVQGEK